MKRSIKKVAVIGSGIMGSGIAAHFANIGIEVLLLDICPPDLKDTSNQNLKNQVVLENINKLKKAKPALLYVPKFSERILAGNLEDDLPKIAHVDWIIEVVVEKLEIKKSIFEQIEKYRQPGTLVSSNTSGISIQAMVEDCSLEFKQHFAATHFFNPVRYLPLLEVIPHEETLLEITNFYLEFGEKFLGKTCVLAKDTPAFIANRIGVFGMMTIFHLLPKFSFGIADIDFLTGTLIGRPKSASFRTADVVGLDTLVHVANGVAQSGVESPEFAPFFQIPDFIQQMLQNQWLGSKTKQGFYQKITSENGDEILEINPKNLEYQASEKKKLPGLDQAKQIENTLDRIKFLCHEKTEVGEFYRHMFGALFAYASAKIPEITSDITSIDSAMKAGFGWDYGPFEIWQHLGPSLGVAMAVSCHHQVAPWVHEMIDDEQHFYHFQDQKLAVYQPEEKKCSAGKNKQNHIILDHIRPHKCLWQNQGAAIIDLGDGIINLEFRSKMNSLSAEVLNAIHKAIDMAEKGYDGLVIANQGQNFSVGASLPMILTMAADQDWDDLNMAVAYFQKTMLRLRYSSIPVVVATHGFTFGGACELAMHADKVVAHAETYMGLVEVGVGLIPAGGGTKEMCQRVSDLWQADDVKSNRLRDAFLNLAMGKASTSAHEAFDLQYLQKHKDVVHLNRNTLIHRAKTEALHLAQQGYVQPLKQKIKVLGQAAMGMFYVGSDQMLAGQYISEHDKKIADKLAYVITGGKLSEPSEVSEQYLLNLEREAFLELCGERKTLERIQQMLQKGKVLRN